MHKSRRGHAVWAVALLGASLASSSARACPYSIRDSAFISAGTPNPYTLYFVVPDDFEQREALAEWVKTGASAWLEEANTEARLLDRVDAESHELLERLPANALAADRLPVPVLVSPEREAMVVPGLEGKKLSQDSVMDVMMHVVESPARITLREQLVKTWCVALLLEGPDKAENQRARQAIDAASKKVVGTTTELGKVITRGVHTLAVRPDDAKERVFLTSLGLSGPDADTSETRVVMLVGRGERRGPVLSGAGITVKKLRELFEMLGRSCSCTTSPMWLTGPAAPLEWGSDMQDAVADELGFDPGNPDAIASIKGVVSGALGPTGFARAPPPGLGYREVVIDPTGGATEVAVRVTDVTVPSGADAPAQAGTAAAPASLAAAPIVPIQSGNRVLLIVIALAVLGLAGATAVVMRRARPA